MRTDRTACATLALLVAAGCGRDDLSPVEPAATSPVATMRVFVVRADDLRPVPGAELFCVSRDFDPGRLPTAEAQRATQELGVDPLLYGRRYGVAVTADAEGVADVPEDTGWIAARADGLFGERGIRVVGLTWTTLSLNVDESARARVVDADGRGVAGVRVALRRVDPRDASAEFQEVGSTGSDGGLVVPHVQRLRASRTCGGVSRTELCVFEPGLESTPGVAFDLDHPPADAIELRMPTAGAIEVVFPAAARAGREWDVQIEEAAPSGALRLFRVRGLTDDRHRWARVAVDRDYVVVTAQHERGVFHRQTVTGPARAGERVVVRFGDRE